MGAIAKIAPKREGHIDIDEIEEQMHVILNQMEECDRIIKQAEKAREKKEQLREQLMELSYDYCKSNDY
ncbi:hypothetical protein D2962_08365 [Biomaibacter acetigenes]|uniref:Uncharacterized protein n=1 Tax=Biomaibacter acetigenes TaxID=2316383 RepID=A0A3G2R5A2_9FIRM|nr:hypothetical protein [Biomaibacter acetigenes]AYO30636.1 hypothetical protein D2962_08365 [Biomaibacter acetigenes]